MAGVEAIHGKRNQQSLIEFFTQFKPGGDEGAMAYTAMARPDIIPMVEDTGMPNIAPPNAGSHLDVNN